VDLSKYVDTVTACANLDALKRTLIAAFEDYGATAVSGYDFPFGGATSTGKREPIISTFPEDVRHAYRECMAGDDPIMYAAMTMGAPIHFLKIEHSLRLSEPVKRVIRALRDAGFQDGVTTPVFAKPGVYAYFSAAFPTPRLDLTIADLRRIKFLFSEFFFRYRELAQRDKAGLSRREREVLVAILNDKSNAQIAADFGVSEHTVETYVRRCFAKLDVTSRTQAALKYLGAGAFDIADGPH
jgi:DNA-binding CsgD family transcriptional regulator